VRWERRGAGADLGTRLLALCRFLLPALALALAVVAFRADAAAAANRRTRLGFEASTPVVEPTTFCVPAEGLRFGPAVNHLQTQNFSFEPSAS
jgi:hypothetical protein